MIFQVLDFASYLVPELGVERYDHKGFAPILGIINRGGRFGDLDKIKEPGEVGHHMQQNAFNEDIGRTRSDGPALGMSTEDHAQTRTYRGKGCATHANEGNLEPINRLEQDVADIRKKFPDGRYEKGIQELIEYAKTLPEYSKDLPRLLKLLRP